MIEDVAGAFEELSTGYGFVEAPRGASDGALWFSDLYGASVYRRDPDGQVQAMLTGRDWLVGSCSTDRVRCCAAVEAGSWHWIPPPG